MVAANTCLGLISMVAGAAVVIMCLLIATPLEEPGLPPGAFPGLMGAFLIVLGACLFWHGRKWEKQCSAQKGQGARAAGKEKTMRQAWETIGSGHSLALAGLVLAYFLTFRYIDYRLGGWLFVLLAMWSLGSRKRLELLVVPPIVSGLLYLTFRYGFSVLLPIWG